MLLRWFAMFLCQHYVAPRDRLESPHVAMASGLLGSDTASGHPAPRLVEEKQKHCLPRTEDHDIGSPEPLSGPTLCCSHVLSRSVEPTRLLHPWDFPGKNTGMGCHFLLSGIFLTQGSNPRLLSLPSCRQILHHWGFPGGTCGKEPACQCRRQGFDPWVRQFPGGGHGNPLQYFCLENRMDRGSWRALVRTVAESDTTEVTAHTRVFASVSCFGFWLHSMWDLSCLARD